MQHLLFIVLLFITNLSFSQNIICYAITNQGDTIKGIYQNFKKDELRLWDFPLKQKINIHADSLKEYILYNSGKKPVAYELFNRFTALPEKQFSIVGLFSKEDNIVALARLAEGEVFIYRYDRTEPRYLPGSDITKDRKVPETISYYFISYDKKNFTSIERLDDLKPVLYKCPEIVAKIGQKGYNKFKHVQKIIEEYNTCRK